MKCYVALGSNLGDRQANLERGARRLREHKMCQGLRASPVYSTPALLPEAAPPEWNKEFLNAAVEVEWSGSALELLHALKEIEAELGRFAAGLELPRWSPRVLDLDILLFGDQVIELEGLTVPHPEMWSRSFVLTPLKDLAPGLMAPGQTQSVLEQARALGLAGPAWMGICNLTPDSFSDGGQFQLESIASQWNQWREGRVSWIDIGGESTRPGAVAMTDDEEWQRLEPVLALIMDLQKEFIFAPQVSVDTYHPLTAARVLERGVQLINDVSGCAHPEMLDVLKHCLSRSSAQYVLMHSLTVPANPSVILPSSCDPVDEVGRWASLNLERLQAAGLNLDQIIFDPGLGFGKTPRQSWQLLQGLKAFKSLPVRLLVGHSRKSFLDASNVHSPQAREPETLALSLRLAMSGVDVVRVHRPLEHLRAWQTFQQLPFEGDRSDSSRSNSHPHI